MREDTTVKGQSNQTDNLSNNLVSMLSGIIIQSIEKEIQPLVTMEMLVIPVVFINKNISTIVPAIGR